MHPSEGTAVVVWSCPIVDPNRDLVRADADSLFAAEQADMGSWVSDGPSAHNGGNDKLDIYVIPATKCVTNRSSTCEAIPDGALAKAVPAPPFTSNGSRRTTSAFILVGSDRVTKPTLKSDLAHEIFHVLQYAHNWNALSKVVTPGAVPVYDNSWFAEASATWAEWHYANAEVKDDNYSIFTSNFQPVNTSLLKFEQAKNGHQYASWVWPLYMEQKNGASAIFSAWAGADNVTTPAQFDQVVSNQLPFDKNFRNFSVQNWNQEMQGNPVPTWQDTPLASDFPLGALHTATNTGEIGAGGVPIVAPTKIDVLAAQYDGYDIKPGVDKITLDFSKLSNVDNLDVDILGRFANNDWRHIAADGHKVELCTKKADEDFDFIRVVLSNHAMDRDASGKGPDPAKRIVGAYTVTTGACGSITGTVAWTYHHSGPIPDSPGTTDDYTENGTVNLSFEPAQFQGFPLPGFQWQDDGSSGFTRTMNETLHSVDGACETTVTITGSRSGSFTAQIDPINPDPTAATVGFFGYDGTLAFDIGPVGKLGIAIPIVDHWHAVSSGPDPCPNHTDDFDEPGDVAPGGLTCVPQLPDGVTNPLGAGGLNGLMTDDGHGNISFDFTCRVADRRERRGQ